MEPIRRRLFNFLTALSLLVCVGVAMLWVRSYRAAPGAEDHFSAYLPWKQARYTARSEKGRLTTYSPPGAPTAAPRGRPKRRDGATAETLVPQLRNDQLEWEIGLWADGRTGPFLSPRLAAGPGKTLLVGHPADRERRRLPVVPWFTKDEAAPALLRALERPDRFVAAHVALADMYGDARTVFWPFTQGPDFRALERRPDGTFVDHFDGLRVELTPQGAPGPPRPLYDVAGEKQYWPPRGLAALHPCSARVDETQLAAIRDQWHRRLDVPAGSTPLWPLALAAAALPAWRWGVSPVRRRLRARARARRGLCRRCGYDLRATRDRCPECGRESSQPVGRA